LIQENRDWTATYLIMSLVLGLTYAVVSGILEQILPRSSDPATNWVQALTRGLPAAAFAFAVIDRPALRRRSGDVALKLATQSEAHRTELRRTADEASATIRDLSERLRIATATARESVRGAWTREIPTTAYSNEVEVECKLIYPLLRLAGYAANDLRMREALTVQLGRQQVRGEADWVALVDNQPYLVVEAKASDQQLTAEVHEQARSYAYALGAPLYCYTNGHEIRAYRRGIRNDTELTRCPVPDLLRQWKSIVTAIGPVSAAHRSDEAPGE